MRNLNLATALHANYRPFWEDKFPGIAVAPLANVNGDLTIRISSADRVEELTFGPAWAAEAIASKTAFVEKMRELDAQVQEIAARLTAPPTIAREIAVVERAWRDYSTAEA